MQLKNGMTVLVVSIMALIGGHRPIEAATHQDLKSEVNTLIAQVDKNSQQSVDVINAINMAIAPALSITVGTVRGANGATVDLPVYFKAGTTGVSGMQFDIALSTGLTATSVAPGVAAQAASKGVQGNPIPGGFRFIVFGINQTTIPSGEVAVIKVAIASNAISGKRPIPISNISGSSPTGTSIPLTGKNGQITVK